AQPDSTGFDDRATASLCQFAQLSDSDLVIVERKVRALSCEFIVQSASIRESERHVPDIVRCLRQPLAVSVAKGFAADGEDVLVHRGRSERTWRQGASDRVHGTDPVRFTASGHHLYVPF